MFKIFLQMLLTLVIGAGAAAGFNPEVREVLSQTAREAKSFTQEIARSLFDDSTAEAETEISAETSSGEAGSETETELSLETGDLPQTIADSSLSVESEAEAETEIEHSGLEVESEVESQLDLGVELGK